MPSSNSSTSLEASSGLSATFDCSSVFLSLLGEWRQSGTQGYGGYIQAVGQDLPLAKLGDVEEENLAYESQERSGTGSSLA